MTAQRKILNAEKLFKPREFEEEMNEVISEFCSKELKPLAQEALKHDTLSESIFDKSVAIFQKFGTHIYAIPEEYGGQKLSSRIATFFTQKVCAVPGAADLGLSVGAGNSLFTEPVFTFGDEELKQYLAPELLAGKYGCFAQTEPDAGSHVANIKTRAIQDKNGIWRITGVKRFITGGWKANYAIVLAISDPEMHKLSADTGMTVFIVNCDEERVKGTLDTNKNEHKLGLTHSPTTEMVFDNAAAFAILGPLHDGYRKVCLPTLGGSRATVIPAQAAGITEAAYNEALNYAKERKAFGVSIDELWAIRGMLRNITARRRMLWALTLQSASLKDEFPPGDTRPYEAEASLAKLISGEYVRLACIDALQIFGGNGYIRDYPVSRLLEDSFITAIYEGTSQVQTMLIARGFLKVFMSGALDDIDNKKIKKQVAKDWPFSQVERKFNKSYDEKFEILKLRERFLNDLVKLNELHPITDTRNFPEAWFKLTPAFGALEGLTLDLEKVLWESGVINGYDETILKREKAIVSSALEELEAEFLN